MECIFKDNNYYKQNLLQRIADDLDSELNDYIIDILNGDKKIEGLDVTKIRWNLFNELRDEIIKNINTELQKENEDLENQLEQAYEFNQFQLSKEQIEQANNWMDTHKCKNRNKSHGAIGGRYAYKFVPTSIGTFCSVSCSCGEEIDISEV